MKDYPQVKEVPEEQTKYSFEKQKVAFQQFGPTRKKVYVSEF
jgi:hypothetical protein